MLRVSAISAGEKLGFYGFGAAAHIAIQVARHWGVEVYASTRDERHQRLAMELGAKWAGGALEAPPEELDAAIVFAPAGEIVPAALKALRKGGQLILGGIHMSEIPSFSYDLLYRRENDSQRCQQYPAGWGRVLAGGGGDSDSNAGADIWAGRSKSGAEHIEERRYRRGSSPASEFLIAWTVI